VFNAQVARDLGCESLVQALAEWIVWNMTDMYPHEINSFLRIECDHSEEYLGQHREEYDWAYSNVENSLKQRQERQMANDDVQGQETRQEVEPSHGNFDHGALR
jgi:hypothetical protein